VSITGITAASISMNGFNSKFCSMEYLHELKIGELNSEAAKQPAQRKKF
jgi:hypothetical protein